ncbi:FYN-binding protein 1 isoform X2 [Scyliorhinus canicula]|uniref:FYN-binding protein 1 isoform X2 n=1 Tax=Scyliorhinus canicula TaxID=7830 RepID=UPI0018F45BAC|nr:FYN-binding protein 1 isoform X2 [Scyliorhinus canicula]
MGQGPNGEDTGYHDFDSKPKEEEVIDFKALREKFQKSDIIKVKPSGKQVSEAPGEPCTESVLRNVDIFETVNLQNAVDEQLHIKLPHPPLLPKPTIVPKPVLLKPPEWTKPSVPVESGRRPEAHITSEGASVGIRPNKLQKPENQISEPRTSEANAQNQKLDTISFKEKLNIWENSLRCTIEPSTPGEKIKCAALPPSLLGSGSNSYSPSKTTYCAEPLFRTASLTQSIKKELSMEPEMQISGAMDEIPPSKEPTMLIQSSNTSKKIYDCAPSLPSKTYLSTPEMNQKGFRLDNNNTVESDVSSALPRRFERLDQANHQEQRFLMEPREGAAHQRDCQDTFMQRRELPSIEVLGPPPVKPPRSFKVDLRAVQNIKVVSCSPMESPKKNGITSSPISRSVEYNILSTESAQEETNNEKEQQHREMEQKNKLHSRESKEKPRVQVKECENKEKRDKELQRKFNITGLEIPIYKVQVQQHLKGGKLGLTVKQGEMVEIIRMVDCPTGKWLAKTQDGNCGYIPIAAVKMDDTEIKEISKRILKQSQIFEEIYDDVGLSEITAEPYSASLFQSIDCEQPYETTETKKESEKRNSISKMNPLTKILQKGKEKKRKGYESSSHVLPSEFESASPVYDDTMSNVLGNQKPSSQNHFADEETLHEQVYDDVETSSSETLKKDRMKELGKLFKKEIGDGEREKRVKMRKEKAQDHLSANSRSHSTLSITKSESDTNSVYEDVNNVKEHGDFEDRTSKSDTSKTSWGNLFRKREENVKRTGEANTKLEETERLEDSNEDGFTADAKATREKVKGIFKGKRKDLNEEKEAKMDKKKLLKEQEFREKFNYTKEIVVENVAVVEQNAVQEKKGPLYLPIKSGEKLDVIDVAEGNQIICRNAEGKYGYVHVRHLIFGTQN